MVSYPRALPCGDSAVSIEFGDRIEEIVNDRVLALDRALAERSVVGIVVTVPTYRALLVHYDPLLTTYALISDLALTLAKGCGIAENGRRRLRIPVCYADEFSADLDAVAAQLHMSAEEVVARHTAAEYRVYMLGFQPGFAYLGGLDPGLALPRRREPRPGALAGTISIAAGQCAIHSVDGPSGWHWIGRTPVQTYAAGAASEFLLQAGDRIRFFAIDATTWNELRHSGATGEIVIAESL